VVPTANPDQLALFQQGKVDAVWTVEPWVSRLELEAGGRIFLEQPATVTTVLVASVRVLRTRPELVARFRAAHLELTAWLDAHPDEARALVRAGLGAEMRREIPAQLVARAWPRLRFSGDISRAEFDRLVAEAQGVGFLRDAIPLDRLFSSRP
jgi:NitT/TauT family transport system substrate-binding protein